MSDLYDDNCIIPHLASQAGTRDTTPPERTFFNAPDIDYSVYDYIILCISGGKDSIACLLHLIDLGVDMRRVELWHHDVDGREDETGLMDWPFMAAYNQKLADTFSLPLYFSWLSDGMRGEMTKHNSYSQPHKFETPDGLVTLERDIRRSKPGTRMRFPQQSASLTTRWCSSALKIDVGRRALNNQSRFDGRRIAFITGERRQESPGRARYNQFEPHACDRKKSQVDHIKPILNWDSEQVWSELEKHRVIAPIPYRLNFSRSSCLTCIYNSPQIWALIKRHFSQRINAIAEYEKRFGVTISRRLLNVLEICDGIEPLEIEDREALSAASKNDYNLPIIQESGTWKLPPGAFSREKCGSD